MDGKLIGIGIADGNSVNKKRTIIVNVNAS